MHHIKLSFLLLFLVGFLQAQNNFWTDVRENEISAGAAPRYIVPEHYRTLKIDLAALKTLLATAPQEQEYLGGEQGLQLEFPMPYGSVSNFSIWEAPVMDPKLTAQYPDIRSYAGRNAMGDYLRFDLSPYGFHAMVLTTDRENSYYIDPYAFGLTSEYICYARKDYKRPANAGFNCLVHDDTDDIPTPGPSVEDRAGSCGFLRTYRLALACTGEYANFHGATGTNKAPALAAMNTSMTRVNGVYEIDAGIRMIIVANNTNVIYTNGATDPYTNNDGSAMLSQNQTTCNAQIGTANYDIGHVYSTGGGGIASLNSPCTSFKAQGVTGQPTPIGDPFDIDYVAHEMGHQFGGQHTQYNNCNRSSSSAMEPGSASSIMGYAGICAPNVQSNSDPYFHARSLQQIATFVNGATGNSCAVQVSNGNNAPTCAALVNKTIPKSTSFVLTAVGSDPDGDPITYCWEQMNAYSNPAQTMPPATTNTSGPVFRTLNPTTSPSRYFPKFSDVLNNTSGTWEKVPSVARTMAFRVTVRDNRAGGGCTTERDVTLTVNGTAGPFVVTSPNTAVNWLGGSSQTITWNVAGTTANGVNCANVKISITTDGGATFTTLLASTPNDGSQAVTIPNVGTSQARILIEAVGNYFYDISNVNFTITPTSPQEFGGNKPGTVSALLVSPNPSSGLIQVRTPEKWQNENLLLRIWDLNGRVVLEETNFNSGNTVEVMSLNPGMYTIEVTFKDESIIGSFIRQ